MGILLQGIVTKGHGVASGRSSSSPYPQGSVAMQMPFFKSLGLDLSNCYIGTLNVSIAPQRWHIVRPTHLFENVIWTNLHPAETFSFVRCNVIHQSQSIPAWLYYPHPETKAAHWQNASVMEIIAPRLEALAYGLRLDLEFEEGVLAINQAI